MWFFWKFLAFLITSGTAYLLDAKNLVNYRGNIKKDVENFCFQEKFLRGPFCVSESFWYQKVFAKEGVSRIFVDNILCQYIENFRRRDFLIFVSTCLCLA